MAKLGMLKNIQSHTGTQDSRSVALTVKDIPIGDIRIKENVRKEYSGINELAESIRLYGLVQPITVYLDGGGYIVKAGHRRFIAYQGLYKTEPERFHSIRCIISDSQNTVLIQLVENVQRVDLSQIDLFNTLSSLREQGMTLRQIADVMSKSEGYVKNLFVGINEISRDEELQVFLDGHASVTIQDIAETSTIPDKQDRLKLLEERKNGNISRAKMRKKARELSGTAPKNETVGIPNEPEKQDTIHVSIKAFPSMKKIIIYQINGGSDGQLVSIEEDLRGYFSANKMKYFLVKNEDSNKK